MAFRTIMDIAEIEDPKGDGDNAVAVRLVEIGGRSKTIALDIRSMWWPEDADSFVPTKKGVMIRSLEEAEELLAAVSTAVDEMREREGATKSAPKRTRRSSSRSA